MSDTHSYTATDPLLPLLLVALVPLLALFPPETRGEALAGCSLLIGLAGLRTLRGSSASIFTVGCSIVCFGLFSATIGESLPFALWPLAMGLLALSVGLSARRATGDARLAVWISWALLLSGALVALHAVYQKFWGFETLLQLVESDADYPDRAAVLTRLARGRAFAAFATPAALGGYMALTLPVSVGLALRSKGWSRWGVWTLGLTQAGALLASASATATVALTAALGLALWRIGSLRRLMLPAAVVLSLLLLGVVWVRGERLINAADREGPLYQRAGNVRVAAEIARDAPWLGVGPGSYAEHYPRYRLPGDNESRHAHNIVAELVADWGVPVGFGLSLLFFAVFLRPLWRRDGDGTSWPLAIGLAAFAVQNLADFGAFMPSLLWTAAIVAGTLSRPSASGDRTPGPPIAVSAAVLTLAVMIAIGSGLAAESRRGARVEAFAGNLTAAVDLAEKSVRWAPWSADAAELLAGLEVDRTPGTDLPADAVNARLEQAIALAPARASLRSLRARWRLERLDTHGAWSDFQRACELYPREDRYCSAAAERAARLGNATDEVER